MKNAQVPLFTYHTDLGDQAPSFSRRKERRWNKLRNIPQCTGRLAQWRIYGVAIALDPTICVHLLYHETEPSMNRAHQLSISVNCLLSAISALLY
jgi:hypothetical protein